MRTAILSFPDAGGKRKQEEQNRVLYGIFSLKGCAEQYNTMQNCIKVEYKNLLKREEELRNAVYGLKVEEKAPLTQKVEVQEKE